MLIVLVSEPVTISGFTIQIPKQRQLHAEMSPQPLEIWSWVGILKAVPVQGLLVALIRRKLLEVLSFLALGVASHSLDNIMLTAPHSWRTFPGFRWQEYFAVGKLGVVIQAQAQLRVEAKRKALIVAFYMSIAPFIWWCPILHHQSIRSLTYFRYSAALSRVADQNQQPCTRLDLCKIWWFFGECLAMNTHVLLSFNKLLLQNRRSWVVSIALHRMEGK